MRVTVVERRAPANRVRQEGQAYQDVEGAALSAPRAADHGDRWARRRVPLHGPSSRGLTSDRQRELIAVMPQSYALTCHAATPTDVVEAVAVRVQRTGFTVLALTFCIDGQLDRLRVPAPETPRMAALLWQHTCFEAFVGRAETSAYHELNLSPSGAWAVHAFRAYRDGDPLSDSSLAPATQVRRTPHHLELDAHVQLDRLSPAYVQATLRLGLAAVIELDDGALTYWSLQHAAGTPDFHHPSAFAVRLEPAPRREHP